MLIAPAGRGFKRIYQNVLTAAAGFVRVEIPQSFSDLMVFADARDNAAVAATGIWFRFNDDATAGLYNYNETVTLGPDTLSVAGNVGASWAKCGGIPGASAPASEFGKLAAVIPNYRGGNFKGFTSQGGYLDAVTTNGIKAFQYFGTYESTDPIEVLTIYAGSSQFVAGTSITVIGLKA